LSWGLLIWLRSDWCFVFAFEMMSFLFLFRFFRIGIGLDIMSYLIESFSHILFCFSPFFSVMCSGLVGILVLSMAFWARPGWIRSDRAIGGINFGDFIQQITRSVS
jgi:hypothetical protein